MYVHTRTHTHIHTLTHTYTYAAHYYNDVYFFSAPANNWTALSPSGSSPSPRYGMGFAATPDGMLYVFGGRYLDLCVCACMYMWRA
jgi:hypothetical protein